MGLRSYLTVEINRYWEIRLSECKKYLEKNNFDAFIAETLLIAWTVRVLIGSVIYGRFMKNHTLREE